MAKDIQAKLKNIKGVFSNSQEGILGKEGIFTVPEYQRAYNWKYDDQCDKLWQDVEAFIENRVGSNNGSYFFGSIIINNDGEKLYVIDGQQRLTTFTLLLKALLIKINKILQTISTDEDAERIKDALESRRRDIIKCLYVIEDEDISSLIKGNIKLSDVKIKYENKSINELHQDEVKTILLWHTFEEIESNVKEIKYKQKDNRYTNFFRNFKFFSEKLEFYGDTEVNNFAKMLLDECQVIVVISYQTDEAIEIFNSLNSTGMPLADADIISAKLYSNYGNDTTKFENDWGEIIRDTDMLNAQKVSTIDDIFNQYMYVLRAKNNEYDTTLPGVRRYFTDINSDSLKDPSKFIEDIQKIIDMWKKDENSKELTALRNVLLKHNNNFKFFYATYLYININEPDEKKQEFVEALLKLFALLSITKIVYSSNHFKTFLIKLNMKIGAGASTNDIVQEIKSHIRDNIQEKFSKERIYDLLVDSDPDNSIVYLNEYLFTKNEGKILNLSESKIEIEHIMPASGRNITTIREDAGMNEIEFLQYANKLGNKILLEQPINGSISNDWFSTKKQKSVRDKQGYKDSNFSIAKSLVDYPKDKWEKEDIDKATQKAAKRITEYVFS